VKAPLLLALPVLAAAAAAYLVLAGREPSSRHDRPSTGDAEKSAQPGPAPGPADPLLPDPGADGSGLPGFVEGAVAKGDAAVAALLGILRSGRDVGAGRIWRFRGATFAGAELDGIPTLRAACLEALRRIRTPAATAALREAFGLCAGVEESYLCALALAERDERGFAAEAFSRSGAVPDPPRLPVQQALVALAASVEPRLALDHLRNSAPRDRSDEDPQVAAAALAGVPAETVPDAARALLEEPAITLRGKSRYVESLLRRKDVAAYRALREICAGGALTDDLRAFVAHHAVQGPVFEEDAAALHVAVAGRDLRAADLLRARLDERYVEARLLVGAAFGVEADRTDDPRALAALRILEEHRKALPR